MIFDDNTSEPIEVDFAALPRMSPQGSRVLLQTMRPLVPCRAAWPPQARGGWRGKSHCCHGIGSGLTASRAALGRAGKLVEDARRTYKDATASANRKRRPIGSCRR